MPKYFWPYWWAYVAQPLTVELDKIEKAYETYREDQDFLDELHDYFKTYCGRPTMLTHCKRLSKELWWAQIYLKREDMTNIWAHKINHSIYQWILALRMWKTELIAETWAWMHGTAVATVWAMLWFPVKVFMWAKDIERQKMNVERIKLLWAEVISVDEWSKTLKDAVNAAMKYWTNNLASSYYLLWSALWPHPYPTIVKEAQSVVWREAKKQFAALTWKNLPDIVCACVWWWSNAIGIFSAYVDDSEVELIWVEAWWHDTKKLWNHAARIDGVWGSEWIMQGYKSLFLQDKHGNMAHTSSISAWLDYAGIWPEHAYLHSIQRVSYTSVSDNQVLDAFDTLARTEWILSALESAHALAYALEKAPTMSPDQHILINLSGRWDKDLHTILEVKAKKMWV